VSDRPQHRSVLIVEDNVTMRALIRSLVEGVGSVVHECADGESAVAYCARQHPDLVLMDVKLAGMDGIAATRAIRRSDPGARIIIVTEQRDEAYRRAATAAGARGFLLKENLLELPALLTEASAAAPEAGDEP
jgi:CheY-like chemotaxis protein